jgi:hypothetical protein
VIQKGTLNYGGGDRIGYEIFPGNDYSSGDSVVTINQSEWQHVAWVGNASHVTIYLNGDTVHTTSLAASSFWDTPSNFYPSSFYTR